MKKQGDTRDGNKIQKQTQTIMDVNIYHWRIGIGHRLDSTDDNIK